MRMTCALIVLGFALAACSRGGEGDTPAEPEEAAAAPAAAEESGIAEDMTDAIEKAEAVEETALQHKEAIDEAVEAAEDDEDAPAEE